MKDITPTDATVPVTQEAAPRTRRATVDAVILKGRLTLSEVGGETVAARAFADEAWSLGAPAVRGSVRIRMAYRVDLKDPDDVQAVTAQVRALAKDIERFGEFDGGPVFGRAPAEEAVFLRDAPDGEATSEDLKQDDSDGE